MLICSIARRPKHSLRRLGQHSASMAVQLPTLPDVERLSPSVIRVLGGNPGKFTLQGTNTYLVGTGRERILIDTGEGKPSWLRSLKSLLDIEQASVSQVLLTHWHPDHVGGRSDILSIQPKTKFYKNQGDGLLNPGSAEQILEIDNDQIFSVEGAQLRALHCPGHTQDHTSFILSSFISQSQEDEHAIFTGDNVLGHGTAVFEDLAGYLSSLALMRDRITSLKANAKINKPVVGYPAHGAVLPDAKAKIEEYIAHRAEREAQVLHALRSHSTDDQGMTPMQITKEVYHAYPVELHAPAERGVMQILDKLKLDGRAIVGDEGSQWRVVS